MTESELNMLYKKIFEKLDMLNSDISDLVIQFSEIFPKSSTNDVYSGEERIPFKNRAKEYKRILKKELL